MFSCKVEGILYCYSTYQEYFEKYKHFVDFHQGIPHKDFLEEYNLGKTRGQKDRQIIVVIDDLMTDLNEDICKLFTIRSHHSNITVFFLIQNLFYQHKYMRTVALNAQYIVLFNLRRDITQIRTLSTQLFTGKDSGMFLSIYKEAVAQRYGYLLIDIHPKNHYRIALRKDVFPDDIETVHMWK